MSLYTPKTVSLNPIFTINASDIAGNDATEATATTNSSSVTKVGSVNITGDTNQTPISFGSIAGSNANWDKINQNYTSFDSELGKYGMTKLNGDGTVIAICAYRGHRIRVFKYRTVTITEWNNASYKMASGGSWQEWNGDHTSPIIFVIGTDTTNYSATTNYWIQMGDDNDFNWDQINLEKI